MNEPWMFVHIFRSGIEFVWSINIYLDRLIKQLVIIHFPTGFDNCLVNLFFPVVKIKG